VIRLDMAQGSPEWLEARRGIPTASRFKDILSPFTLKPLAGSQKYLLQLLAEWALGVNVDEDVTQFMQRGSALEDAAIGFYALERDCDPVRPGIVLRDDRLVGCSPDLLVGEDGGCEIKCPSAAVHIGYLLDDDPAQYRCQMQGALWLTGRAWWDFLSYHPTLPPVLLHFERDEAFIKTLAEVVGDFVGRMLVAREDLRNKGVVPVVSAPQANDLTAALAGVLD
jgi:hypothetical protein